jgi:molybdopterin converting factor small subunit
MTAIKKHFKQGIRVFLENDADICKIVIRMSKTQLLRALDYILPDDEEVVVVTKKN